MMMMAINNMIMTVMKRVRIMMVVRIGVLMINMWVMMGLEDEGDDADS